VGDSGGGLKKNIGGLEKAGLPPKAHRRNRRIGLGGKRVACKEQAWGNERVFLVAEKRKKEGF